VALPDGLSDTIGGELMDIFLILVALGVVLAAAFIWQRRRGSVGDSRARSRQSSTVESRLRDGRGDDPGKMGGKIGL
jgi:hypothetical protein